MPSEQTYIKSLDATFTEESRQSYRNKHYCVDSCCRSLYKCEANKRFELNQTNYTNIRHCQCVHSFRACLKNSNSTISDELAFIHSINATKCYEKSFPIVECLEFEPYLKSEAQLNGSGSIALTEREKFFNRCLRFKFDESQPQIVQLFDLPLGDYNMSSVIVEKCQPISPSEPGYITPTTTIKPCPFSNNLTESEMTLFKEMTDAAVRKEQYFTDLDVDNDSFFNWNGLILPTKEPYNKRAFRVSFNFTEDYPFHPPKILFTTKIYHPNIQTNMTQVILALNDLVSDPDPEHPLRADLAEEFQKDRKKFFEAAEEFTIQYGEERPII